MNRLKSKRIKIIWALIMGFFTLAPGALDARLDRYVSASPEAPCVGDHDDFEEPEVEVMYTHAALYSALRACNRATVAAVLELPGAPPSFADSAFGLYGSPLHWLVTNNSNLNDQASSIASVLLGRGVSMGVVNGDNKRAYEVLTAYVAELRAMPVPEPAGGDAHRALVELHRCTHALAKWLEVHDELWLDAIDYPMAPAVL